MDNITKKEAIEKAKKLNEIKTKRVKDGKTIKK